MSIWKRLKKLEAEYSLDYPYHIDTTAGHVARLSSEIKALNKRLNKRQEETRDIIYSVLNEKVRAPEEPIGEYWNGVKLLSFTQDDIVERHDESDDLKICGFFHVEYMGRWKTTEWIKRADYFLYDEIHDKRRDAIRKAHEAKK